MVAPNELNERYLTDQQGNRVGVLLDIDVFNRVVEALEELADVRAYDEAVAEGGEPVPLDQVLRDIEAERP